MEITISKLKCLLLEWGGIVSAFKTYGIECHIELYQSRLKKAVFYHWLLSTGCYDNLLCEAQSFINSFDCTCTGCDSVELCTPFTITVVIDDPRETFTIDDP